HEWPRISTNIAARSADKDTQREGPKFRKSRVQHLRNFGPSRKVTACGAFLIGAYSWPSCPAEVLAKEDRGQKSYSTVSHSVSFMPLIKATCAARSSPATGKLRRSRSCRLILTESAAVSACAAARPRPCCRPPINSR